MEVIKYMLQLNYILFKKISKIAIPNTKFQMANWQGRLYFFKYSHYTHQHNYLAVCSINL